MGLLTGGKGLFDKTKKKKDLLSQTALVTMMEKSSDGKDFNSNMDEYLKNKNKQDIAIGEQIRVQQDRLNLSDAYLAELPVEEGISQVKSMRTMIGAGVLALVEQSASAYMDIQVMKSRDITKQARWNTTKKASNLALSLAGGAIAGSIVPGLGTAVGAIAAGVLYIGKETVNYFSNKAKEDFDISQANKEAEISTLTLGTIINDGNRKSK